MLVGSRMGSAVMLKTLRGRQLDWPTAYLEASSPKEQWPELRERLAQLPPDDDEAVAAARLFREIEARMRRPVVQEADAARR